MDRNVVDGITFIELTKAELQELIARCPYNCFSIESKTKKDWVPKYSFIEERPEQWYKIEVV